MIIGPAQEKIWTIFDREQEKFLRRPADKFDFASYAKKDVDRLIAFMRAAMVRSDGVGLSANQIGLNMQLFVCQLPAPNGNGYKGKFFAIFNPRLQSIGSDKIASQEGCLSVPGYYGTVERFDRVIVDGLDKNQHPIHIKARGFLATIFQHEFDHLNGVIFTDKARDITRVAPPGGEKI